MHGFRSTWCTECTRFTPEEREVALAHKVGTAVTEADRRTDLFDKRRALAEAWAASCAGGPRSSIFPLQCGRRSL